MHVEKYRDWEIPAAEFEAIRADHLRDNMLKAVRETWPLEADRLEGEDANHAELKRYINIYNNNLIAKFKDTYFPNSNVGN